MSQVDRLPNWLVYELTDREGSGTDILFDKSNGKMAVVYPPATCSLGHEDRSHMQKDGPNLVER